MRNMRSLCSIMYILLSVFVDSSTGYGHVCEDQFFFLLPTLQFKLSCHSCIHSSGINFAVLHPCRLAYTPFCLYLDLSLVERAFLHSDNYLTHCAAPGTHQGLCVPFASLHCFLSRNITSLDHFLECPSMMIFHCLIPCCGDPV
jgi:hypothetical protein